MPGWTLILEVGFGGLECVRLPGWAVVAVAALLTAPRLARDWIEQRDK